MLVNNARTGGADGVDVNLVSTRKLERMAPQEKIAYILEQVVAGKILVLERGLTSREEARLIEETMRSIDPDGFIGIEMHSYGTEAPSGWSRIVSKKKAGRPRMAVVGPADKLKISKKNNQEIQALIYAGVAPAET